MNRLDNDIIFQIVAILILIFFYAIYIGKMVIQRRKGIQTDQIARGQKEKSLFLTEAIMKIATYSIVIAEVISIYFNTAFSFVIPRIIGISFGIIGVVFFGMAVYTMRDSWRAGISKSDKTELVVTGIFDISRNPAFLGFNLVYIGILLMFFNWILLIFTIFAITMLHLQILQEEKFLPIVFGENYLAYKEQTKRYFGKKVNYKKEYLN